MLRKFWKNWMASEAHSQKGIRALVVLEWIYQVAAFIGSLSNLRAVFKCFSSLCFCRKLLFLFKVKLKLAPFYNIFSSWYIAYQIGFHAVWLNKDLIEKILKIVICNPGLPTELWRSPARLVEWPGTEAGVYWVISLLILLLRKFGSVSLVELNSIILDYFFLPY